MQNKLPLLSVIIPCYKVEKYLDRCMSSVVGQTYKNLEIILVDDGSPDNTGVLCDKWAKQDNRIKVIHKQNEGLGFARNSGLEIATGDFVAFVDSDDYIDSSMYERLICKSMEIQADIVYCGINRQRSDLNVYAECDFAEERIFEHEALITLSRGFYKPTIETPNMLSMSVWHAVYSRSVLVVPFYSEREVGSEDLHFQISAMLNANRVCFIPDALYFYCYNGESLSHSFIAEKIKRYERLSKYVNRIYKELGEEGNAEYYTFIIAFVSIMQVLQFNNHRMAKNYIMQLANDHFWNKCRFDDIKLDFSKKIILFCLRNHMGSTLYFMSSVYYLLFYKLAKKSHR